MQTMWVLLPYLVL